MGNVGRGEDDHNGTNFGSERVKKGRCSEMISGVGCFASLVRR